MSLANEWKKEIADMSSPSRTSKDKLIDIKDKRKSKTPRSSRRRTSNKRPSSLFQDIAKSISNNSYVAYIAVFCLFYLLGWFVVFTTLDEAEHESKHKAHSSLLHPNGDLTHHLPKQIQSQIDKLAALEKMHEHKEVINEIKNAQSESDNLILSKINAHNQVCTISHTH